jgi:hypothetical protein
LGARGAVLGPPRAHGHGCGNFDSANAVGKYFCWSCDGHISSILTDFKATAKRPVKKP